MRMFRSLLLAGLIAMLGSASAEAQVCNSSTVGTRQYLPVPTKPVTQVSPSIQVYEEDEHECFDLLGWYLWLPTFQARYTIYGVNGGTCTRILRGSIVATPGLNPLCGAVGSISSMAHYLDPSTNQPLIQREDCLNHPTLIAYALPNGAPIAIGNAIPSGHCQ